LRWVPRTSTHAAQKIPTNTEDQLFDMFLRTALWIRDNGIRHPDLIVNFDQTNIIIGDSGARTFDVEGTKQVGVVSKEEKRAWTAVVGISASGAVLPTQVVMKGVTSRSLPSPHAPAMAEAQHLGIRFECNPKNHWSNLPCMMAYFRDIVVPYFLGRKLALGYAPDVECRANLDAWVIHRSKEFRRSVRQKWPWLRLGFIPGGCTSI
ncbi:uncharacterized protein STEHIDRAFT_31056, partial [Stereum hirsutum FP-91666 SS1]|uniref:uncharacterized protein n=1 Tax=Stereum hirsutum (strain FP-91666) TaxID=721885 RepID=UPI00044493E6